MSHLVQLVTEHWAIAAIAAACGIALWIARGSRRDVLRAYQRRGPLVTEAELRFYWALQQAVGGSWAVFTMVRLADLIKVRPNIAGEQAWRNLTFGKHIDFVLCEHETLDVRLAIELDDATHNQPDRQKRDAFVNDALASAGLPLLRVDLADRYDRVELRRLIDHILDKR